MPAEINTPQLVLHQLNQSRGNRAVLHGLDLVLMPGELVGVIGPNGSGKTTLLRSISGRLPVTQGSVCIAGLDPSLEPKEARRHTGTVPDGDQLPPALSGNQLLELWSQAWQLGGIPAETIELAARVELAERLGEPLETWSLGMKQKLALLLALMPRPRLLLLDESFNSLDPLSAWTLRRELRAQCDAGAAALVCSHQIGQLEKDCDRVLLLLDGHWVKGWTREERQREAAAGRDLEDLFIAALGDRPAQQPVYGKGTPHGD